MAETKNIPTPENEKDRISRVAKRGQASHDQGGGKRIKGWSTKKTVIVTVCTVAAILLLAGTAFSAYALVAYDKVYPGVRVDDLDLSGLSRSKALELVTSYYSNRTPARSFTLTIGENTYAVSITPEDMGYDTRKTAEDAWLYGRQGGVFQRLGAMISCLRGNVELVPALIINDANLEAKAADIARQVEQEIAEAVYTFEDGKLIVDKGQAGTSIDEKELLGFLKDRMLKGEFTDTTFALTENAPDVLNLLLIKSEIEQDFRNPSLDLENDPTGNTVLPAQTGIRMDLEKATAILESSSERYVEIPLEVTEPQYTTEQFKQYLFRDVLATSTTKFNANLTGRTKNVRLATDLCNQVILNPGDTFSFNETVGKRTYERGFMDATIYVGNETEEGVGGGVCQVSSTIYHACLRADLEIVERKCHSRNVTYVPLGEDATVAWGYIDYQFKNNTDFPLKLITSHDKNTLTVELVGTQTTPGKEVKIDTTQLSKTSYEKVYVVDETLPLGTEKKRDTGYTGYTSESYRVVYIDGEEVSRTFENKSTYKKYDEVWLHNPDPNAPVDGEIPGITEPGEAGTEPGATEPPATEPPVTEPPITEPPVTEPPVSDPPPDPEPNPGTVPSDPPEHPEPPDPLTPGQGNSEP